jgi:hypothetical protein
MVKNLSHCETGFGVYRSAQRHIPFFITLSVRRPGYRVAKYFTFVVGTHFMNVVTRARIMSSKRANQLHQMYLC